MQVLLYTWTIKKQDFFLICARKMHNPFLFALRQSGRKVARSGIKSGFPRPDFSLLPIGRRRACTPCFCVAPSVARGVLFAQKSGTGHVTGSSLSIHCESTRIRYLNIRARTQDRPPILPPIPSQSKASVEKRELLIFGLYRSANNGRFNLLRNIGLSTAMSVL